MNDGEKAVIYDEIKKIADLLEDYESYRIENSRHFKRKIIFEKMWTGSGICLWFITLILGIAGFCTANVYGITEFIFAVALMFISAAVLVVTASLSAFRLDNQKHFITDGEFEIYCKNKKAFISVKELAFPKDYMCSGYAKAVLKEIKYRQKADLGDIYKKCKFIEYDILRDNSAEFIRFNRGYVQKIQAFMGL